MKFVSSITIQSWGTGHRVTTGKEIENDRYRNEGGPVQSGQSESPNPCNHSMGWPVNRHAYNTQQTYIW